jgi:predicted  nucleic acid-binding Zn-ribbon protein
VKATPEHQKRLLNMQDIDTRLARLEHAEKSLSHDETLAALDTKLDNVVHRYGVSVGILEDARAELRRVESDVAVVEARIERDSARLQGTASVKDVQALEAELRSLTTRRSDLEDAQLEVMEKVEKCEGEYADIDTEREVIAQSMAEARTQRDLKLANLAQERAAALAERYELTASLPADLMALYERQRERYGIGAALLRGGVSLGSNVKLNESDLADMRRAAPDDVILCPDSSAILVRTEESGL